MIAATDGAGLFRAIIEDPNDPVARAVLCDWLIDQGDSVALEWLELIRSGKEVRAQNSGNGQWGSADGCCNGWIATSPLISEGLRRPAFRILRELHLPLPSTAVVRRGFVDEVGCMLDDWRRCGPAVVLAHPVRRVVPADLQPQHVEREPGFHPWRWGPAVPQWLGEHLPSGWYPTDGAAIHDASIRLVRWARKEAGLASQVQNV